VKHPKEEQLSICITTMVSGLYEWYVPLFLYCGLKAYPEYDFKVLLRGRTNLPDTYKSHILDNRYSDYPQNGPTTAALRFIEGEKEFSEYDCCLITDVDVLLMREDPKLVTQHLAHMIQYKMECYCNYQSHQLPGGYRCSGVHFIMKDWWERTRESRMKWMFNAKNGECSEKDSDEIMLGEIIRDSGLNDPTEKQLLWNIHGIHLKRWWPKANPRELPQAGAQESLLMQGLLEDEEFMELASMCAGHLPKISGIVGTIRQVIRGGR